MRAVERLNLAAETIRTHLWGMSVVIEDTPTDEFQEALDYLVPEDEPIARFVHRTLAQPTSAPKRNVVVHRRGEPVLATTLRARHDRWEIATSTVAPTLRIPHRAGCLEPALAAVGLRILIQEYFGDAMGDFGRQKLTPFDSYVARLDGFDYEDYWRSTGALYNIRRARKKTGDIAIARDDPSTITWAIDTWEARWRDSSSGEAGAADDLRAVWPTLLKRGRLMTTGLISPQGNHVAATVDLIEGDTLVGLITARDTEYPIAGASVGTLAILASWDGARAAGLATVDIGSYDSYKRRLTPPGRVFYQVEIAPRLVAPRRVARARHIAGRAKRGLRRLAAPIIGCLR